MGGTVPPASSHHATPASLFGPSEAAPTGVHSYRQTPVPARRRAGRQPVPKSKKSSSITSSGRGFEAYASRSGEKAAVEQGSVGFLQHPQIQAAPDRSGDFTQLIEAVCLLLFYRRC